MKDYLNYEPEDFAQDDFFIYWVKSADFDAETFWQNWLGTYPFKRNDIEAARQLVLLTAQLPEHIFPDAEIKAIKSRIFQKVEENDHIEKRIRPLLPYWLAAAVITTLLCLAGWYAFRLRQDPETQYNHVLADAARKYELIEIQNPNKQTRLVNLPDGSTVILKQGSKLSYPNYFAADSREVFLTGEAFFEIAKDREKPFFVFAGEVITKVLGTSFTIKSYPRDKEILVTVKTGKVSVFNAKGPYAQGQLAHKRLDGFVVEPNQRAIFTKNRESLVKKQVVAEDEKTESLAEVMIFEYEDFPVSKVFEQLENAYQIKILYDKKAFGKCPITASLTDEPFNEKIKLICKAIRANYEMVNGEVIVTAKKM